VGGSHIDGTHDLISVLELFLEWNKGGDIYDPGWLCHHRTMMHMSLPIMPMDLKMW